MTDKNGHLIVPDAWFFVIEAAQILGCSAIELDNHPDKAMWMQRAHDYNNGLTEGKTQLRMNVKFWKIQQQNWQREETAQKAAKSG